jgi:hypothetical protein
MVGVVRSRGGGSLSTLRMLIEPSDQSTILNFREADVLRGE